ncbi:uncharacterized protein A4U43_C03F8010 [Asparagus officinalis]|uniref:Protein ENHANCED DISEASE RESISTANCE 2 C-terminal domain-containing protein n=1 Tax=Asparagus officinalis TaxID=4686 RepID=A0A5P1F884_ASPOF|nr:uncharacterized protein A4U43_C03F8010 [Asparagus officinalis]
MCSQNEPMRDAEAKIVSQVFPLEAPSKLCSGENYPEIDVDIRSSAIANVVLHLALGYVKAVMIDMRFVVEAQEEEELPERLIGAVRIAQMELSSATFLETLAAAPKAAVAGKGTKKFGLMGCNLVGHLGFLALHFWKGGCNGMGAWLFNSVLNAALLTLFLNCHVRRAVERRKRTLALDDDGDCGSHRCSRPAPQDFSQGKKEN